VVIIPTLPASPVLQQGTNTVTEGNGSSFSQTQVTGNGQGPACNSIIQQVLSAKQSQYGASHVMAGPDLWGDTVGPNTHWSSDGLHPYGDTQGIGVLRSAWVKWAETNIFGSVL
jgi:hypothetical protein